jgi:hypothetical protein
VSGLGALGASIRSSFGHLGAVFGTETRWRFACDERRQNLRRDTRPASVFDREPIYRSLKCLGGSLLTSFEFGIGVAVFEILGRGPGSSSSRTDLTKPIAVIITLVLYLNFLYLVYLLDLFTGVGVGIGGASDQGQHRHECGKCDCELRAHFLSPCDVSRFGSPDTQFRFGLTAYITNNVSNPRRGTARRNIFWKTSLDPHKLTNDC